jgi:hypothetical protein
MNFHFSVEKNLDNKKVTSISNPCSFQLKNNPIEINKTNTLLYVGRINFPQSVLIYLLIFGIKYIEIFLTGIW